jgi:hypothetical protein
MPFHYTHGTIALDTTPSEASGQARHPLSEYGKIAAKVAQTLGMTRVLVFGPGAAPDADLKNLRAVLPAHVRVVKYSDQDTIDAKEFAGMHAFGELLVMAECAYYIGSFSNANGKLVPTMMAWHSAAPPAHDMDGDLWFPRAPAQAWHYYRAHATQVGVEHRASQRLRLVVVVGTEHSGHDIITEALQSSAALGIPVHTELSAELSKLTLATTAEAYRTARHRMVDIVHELLQQQQQSNDNHKQTNGTGNNNLNIQMLQLKHGKDVYPDMHGSLKLLKHPDLSAFVRTMHHAGIYLDLRIVVAMRHPGACLAAGLHSPVSTLRADERQLKAPKQDLFLWQARVLRDALCVLDAELRSIDAAFHHVVHFEDVVSSSRTRAVATAHALAAFLLDDDDDDDNADATSSATTLVTRGRQLAAEMHNVLVRKRKHEKKKAQEQQKP